MKIDWVQTILILILIFLVFASIDNEQITTNEVVDCIDGRYNFISNQTCYKIVYCGDKINLFNSKYCDEEYAFVSNSEKDKGGRKE